MTIRTAAGAAFLALGFAYAPAAHAMNLQPGMLTMMQQGGQEHGVQPGCKLPGYDPQRTCATLDRSATSGLPTPRDDRRPGRVARS